MQFLSFVLLALCSLSAAWSVQEGCLILEDSCTYDCLCLQSVNPQATEQVTVDFTWDLCGSCDITQAAFVISNGRITGFTRVAQCRYITSVVGNGARSVESGSICLSGLCATFGTRATAAGDPHLTTIDGVRFDFDGEIGHSYALLSSEHVQVNTKLGHYSSEFPTVDVGQWMKDLCVRVSGAVAGANKDQQIRLSVGPDEFSSSPDTAAAYLSVDGTKYDFLSDQTLIVSTQLYVNIHAVDGDATTFGSGYKGHAKAVVDIWISEQFSIRVFVIEEGWYANQWVKIPHRHLDVQVLPLRLGLAMEGIIAAKEVRDAEEYEVVGDTCSVLFPHSLYRIL